MNIDTIFNNIRNTREAFISLLNNLSENQFNEIPDGFNNNIAWNFGHIVVTTQALCYQRTGVEPDFAIPYQAFYGKDSKPTYFIGAEELQLFCELAKSTIDQIETDYHEGRFGEIRSFSTGTYKIELHSIEEVLLTTLMHDNLHYGYAMAQKRSKNS